MTIAELHTIMTARFTSQGAKIDAMQEDIHEIKLGVAKRVGAFAVLTKLGLVLIGIGSAIAGGAIINAI